MRKPNSEIIKTHTKAFAERGDVRNLAILLVAGLLSPFEYVDKLAELALEARLDDPVSLN